MTGTTPHAARSGRTRTVLFLTIFIAMLGLSILFPIIAPLGRELGLSETQTAWFATAYSLMQFVCSPLWGARSERRGRRPVLLLGLTGFAVSFGLFGLIAELGLRGVLTGVPLFALLVATRVLGGVLSSATLPTAQAMMADLSSTGDRAAGMGLIGAAFGLGVVFGPGLGAVLSGLGLTAPVYFSAALGAVTALVASRVLPETRHVTAATAPGANRRRLLGRPGILMFLALSAVTTLASVGMEQTIGFFVQDTLHLTPAGAAQRIGGMLAVFGIVAALVQGGAIRPLSRRVSPTPLIAAGLAIMAAGMVVLPGMTAFWPITLALAVIGVGSAIVSPSLSAALSLSVGDDEQGTVAGLNSSALALGRMTGPLIGTGLYQHAGHGAPYLLSGCVLGAALLWTLIVRPRVSVHVPAAAP
ncbi:MULTISPECIES: MFS transporter [Deinococcus]|uniref:MFS transporter n=1 Tax=Deinococcus rufus TaxID=2136097 RepID=A0ABV7ZCE3_9DEIO|nr:MFS transporter [Deinococcus sp. AB2017081]WQE93813.1 MFS transporter [Deinococcus sp. AB2017081]